MIKAISYTYINTTVLYLDKLLLAIIGNSHNNLYTSDSNSTSIIYNSTGNVISTMYNAIGDSYKSDTWHQVYIDQQTVFIPDYFATLALNSNNDDRYIVMYGYDRVKKFTLNI